MLTVHTQRWRAHRSSYRPAGEPIDTTRFEVAKIASDSLAKAFVLEHHYLDSYPAARRRIGLYERSGRMCGVAVFSVPCNPATLSCLGCDLSAALELGRFVLLAEVPANGETWFLGRCFSLLKSEGFEGVVSFSDPEPRMDAEGTVFFGGHIGTIYQAHNAIYLGRARAKYMAMLPDRRTLHRRALAKLKSGDRGWRYVAKQLVSYGATPPPDTQAARVKWASTWTSKLVRRVRHGGNLKYAWGLTRNVRRALPDSKPYPKSSDFRQKTLDI